MARPIDADALEALIRQEPTDGMFTEEILEIIREQPTIEAAPVVHGRWKTVKYNVHCSCGKSYGTYHYLCSACNRISYAQPYGLNYCPNCGAKMDGEPNG